MPKQVTGECLLGGGASGLLRVATYDTPEGLEDPPGDLDALLEQKPGRGGGGFDPPGIRLKTSWGGTEGGDYLDLVALSPAPKSINSGPTPILIATDRGLYLGLIGRPTDGTRLDAPSLARIKNELVPKAKVWIVTAEGDAPLAKVREALAVIKDSKGTVILASPVASPGRRTARPSRYDSRVPKGSKDACDDDMMAVKGPPGEYKMGTFSRLAETMERAGKSCGDALAAGRGGSIHVMLRIAADGHIDKACAETDDVGDDTVRACVVDAIRKAKIPAPDQKKGRVNFGTALLFNGKAVRPLCE
jgi:hypothetical protein